MKKTLLALSVALVATSTAYAAIPQSGTLGVRGGFAFVEDNSNNNVSISEDVGYGVGAYFGYNFTSWAGIEAGYDYFGNFEAKDKAGKTTDMRLRGPQFAARLALPLDADGSDIFLRAGGMFARTAIESYHENNWAPLVGLGVQYNFSNGVGLRAGYDHVFNAFSADDARYDNLDTDLGYGYVGLSYTFGKAAPAPAVAPAEPQKAEPQAYTYKLDAGALFPFDGSTLSDDGKKQIADVVSHVNAQGLDGVSYDVKGHTDRLGSEQYNQKLSEKRAKSVADVLIANGVAEDNVTSVGYGESQPVTGNQCDGLSRAKLVKCLGPDRRVEITVQGNGTMQQ